MWWQGRDRTNDVLRVMGPPARAGLERSAGDSCSFNCAYPVHAHPPQPPNSSPGHGPIAVQLEPTRLSSPPGSFGSPIICVRTRTTRGRGSKIAQRPSGPAASSQGFYHTRSAVWRTQQCSPGSGARPGIASADARTHPPRLGPEYRATTFVHNHLGFLAGFSTPRADRQQISESSCHRPSAPRNRQGNPGAFMAASGTQAPLTSRNCRSQTDVAAVRYAYK